MAMISGGRKSISLQGSNAVMVFESNSQKDDGVVSLLGGPHWERSTKDTQTQNM